MGNRLGVDPTQRESLPSALVGKVRRVKPRPEPSQIEELMRILSEESGDDHGDWPNGFRAAPAPKTAAEGGDPKR